MGKGGLIRHTRAAAQIGKDLLNMEMYQAVFTERQRDLILVAITLHDSHKQGVASKGHTVFEHPLLAANFVRGLLGLPDDEKEFIAKCIASHMGQWNTNKRETTILDKPKTAAEKFVHLCDYLASRKYLEFQFDDYTPPKPLTLNNPGDYVFSFGKHSGSSIAEVAVKDKGYLRWLISSSCNLEGHDSQKYTKKFLEM